MAHLDSSRGDEALKHRRHTQLFVGVAVVETLYHVTQLVLLALLMFLVNFNYLWGIFNFTFVFFDLVVSMGYLGTLHNDGLGEFVFIDLIPVLQLGSFFCKGDRKGLSIWLLWQNVFWALLVLLWIRPAFLYTDAIGGTFGGTTSLAGKSSCSTFSFTPAPQGSCIQSAGDPIVYNPFGEFSVNNPFRLAGLYSTCYLDQHWAGPTFSNNASWIGGYTRDGLTTCTTQVATGGFVSRTGCPALQSDVCPQGYPGLWYGLQVNTDSTDYLTNTTGLIKLCPGNTGLSVNVDGRQVKGKPLPVCNKCLWYVIYQAQLEGRPLNTREGCQRPNTTQDPICISNDILQTCLPGWTQGVNYPPDSWAGWRSYPDGTTDPSGVCGFCPGRGVGWWGFSSEVYDTGGIQQSYWFYTAVALIVPGARKFLVGVAMFAVGARECCPEKHHWKRGYRKLSNKIERRV